MHDTNRCTPAAAACENNVVSDSDQVAEDLGTQPESQAKFSKNPLTCRCWRSLQLLGRSAVQVEVVLLGRKVGGGPAMASSV